MVDVSKVQASLGLPLAEQISTLGIRVSIPQVFVGMLIGGALPWLFSSFCIQAVSRAASLIVEEVRRQFRLGVLEGKVKPDYRLHHCGSKRVDQSGNNKRGISDISRIAFSGRSIGRIPGRDNPFRSVACGFYGKRRRRLG
jgi:hypothetical protein